MVVDVELTLNRFGFGRVSANKVQIGCLRLAWWELPGKHAASFEVNWRRRPVARPIPSDPIFERVKRVLDDADVEGLLKMGAPPDEYASEARTLAEAIRRGRTMTPEYVRDVWLRSFGCGEMPDGTVHVGEMAMRDDFVTIAERLATNDGTDTTKEP